MVFVRDNLIFLEEAGVVLHCLVPLYCSISTGGYESQSSVMGLDLIVGDETNVETSLLQVHKISCQECQSNDSDGVVTCPLSVGAVTVVDGSL